MQKQSTRSTFKLDTLVDVPQIICSTTLKGLLSVVLGVPLYKHQLLLNKFCEEFSTRELS